jgi:hypothetical protein
MASVVHVSPTTAEASTSTADGEVKFKRGAYKKDPTQRIFVGRSLRLEKIKFFGFDLDYTVGIT